MLIISIYAKYRQQSCNVFIQFTNIVDDAYAIHATIWYQFDIVVYDLCCSFYILVTHSFNISGFYSYTATYVSTIKYDMIHHEAVTHSINSFIFKCLQT